MKKGQLNKILIMVLVCFVLILVGSFFDFFSFTGKIINGENCEKKPVNIICPEDQNIIPIFDKDGCVTDYQCGVLNCPNVEVPDCRFDKAPYPLFGWYNKEYCVYGYECIKKVKCDNAKRPLYECGGENTLIPVYNSDGCVVSWQCSHGYVLGIENTR